MGFYNEKIVLLEDEFHNLGIFRCIKREIILTFFDHGKESSKKYSLAKDSTNEFDISLSTNGSTYLVYQNTNMDLILTVIKEGKKEDVKLTSEPIVKIFELNILAIEDTIHILYFVPIPGNRKYRIYHHYYDGEIWFTYTVDDIKVSKALNPLKLIVEDERIFLGYYDFNQINLKIFAMKENQWNEAMELKDNKDENLYMDMMKKEDKIFLTYCQNVNDNYVVKFESILFKNGKLERQVEHTLSNEENPTNPNLIYFGDKLWITWNQSNIILSRYSLDLGQTWSPQYLWKDSRKVDFVRYKYISTPDKEKILEHSFGEIGPNIRFIGFGPLEDVEEIPIRKNIDIRFPQI